MTIEKELKTIDSSFKGFYKDLNDIALQIAGVEEMRADMEATGNYTPVYIDEMIEKEINTKAAPRVASILDIIGAGADDLQEATKNILFAPDVFEDSRISSASAIVANLAPDSRSSEAAAEMIAKQFAGAFPVLALFASICKDSKCKAIISKNCIDSEALESLIDSFKGELFSMSLDNSKGDFVALSTRLYSLEKLIAKYADIYGVKIAREDYKAINALFETKQFDAVRAAMGL